MSWGKNAVAIVFLINIPFLVQAELSAEQEAYLQKAQTYLDDASLSYKAYALDMCGYDIPTKIEPDLVAPFMKAGSELKNYCEEVRTKVALICRDGADALKNKVKEQVKSITCKLAKKADEVSFKLVGTELQASFNTKSSDIDRAVLKFLENTKAAMPAKNSKSKK